MRLFRQSWAGEVFTKLLVRITSLLFTVMFFIGGLPLQAQALNLAQFTAGFVWELGLHEGGHELISQSKDVPITWESSRLSWKISDINDENASDVRLMSMAGLGVQSISRKVSRASGWTDSDFHLGRIAYSYGNAFWYAGRQLLSKQGAYHDFAVYEQAGGNADRMAVLIGLDVIFDTIFLFQDRPFRNYIKDNRLTFEWRY